MFPEYQPLFNQWDEIVNRTAKQILQQNNNKHVNTNSNKTVAKLARELGPLVNKMYTGNDINVYTQLLESMNFIEIFYQNLPVVV